MRRCVAAALALAAMGAGACGGQRSAEVPRARAGSAEVRSDSVPQTLNGLVTQEVDVTSQFAQAKDRAYVTGVRLWSLREGERLRATLEVARFATDARPESRRFRDTVVSQVGQTAPRLRKVGDQEVFVTPGNRQTIFMWFRGIYFIVLSASVEYRDPRSLLRVAVQEVKP